MGLLLEGEEDLEVDVRVSAATRLTRKALGIYLMPIGMALRRRVGARAAELFDCIAPTSHSALDERRLDRGLSACSFRPLGSDTFAANEGGMTKETLYHSQDRAGGYWLAAAYPGGRGLWLEGARSRGAQAAGGKTDLNPAALVGNVPRLAREITACDRPASISVGCLVTGNPRWTDLAPQGASLDDVRPTRREQPRAAGTRVTTMGVLEEVQGIARHVRNLPWLTVRTGAGLSVPFNRSARQIQRGASLDVRLARHEPEAETKLLSFS